MSINDGFKALSDPTRRKILKLLKDGDLTAGEIANQFDISKPSISHHLTLLKQSDLISSTKKGQHMIYSLNTSVFEDMITWFLDFQSNEREGL